MKSRILSLNVGPPAPMEWEGKSLISSMHKKPIAGPLQVHQDRIDGDSFQNPRYHGTIDSVLYAFGLTSALEFMRSLGREIYEPGAVGENVTLDQLDEKEVSVGDVFQFGEVLAQATFPRIPCGKVNFRLRHPQGQKLMQQCGRSGVYFRILKPGRIQADDPVVRTQTARIRFTIHEVYNKEMTQEGLSPQDIERAIANGAFPQAMQRNWKTKS